MSHSFIRFTAWRWAPPVVWVEGSDAWRSFLCFVCLFFLFLLFVDFVILAVIAYLAPGCGENTLNIRLFNFTVLFFLKCTGLDYCSLVSSCFFLLGDLVTTGLSDPSSSSSSVSLHLFFFGLATPTGDSMSWDEISSKCFSVKEEMLLYFVLCVHTDMQVILKLTAPIILKLNAHRNIDNYAQGIDTVCYDELNIDVTFPLLFGCLVCLLWVFRFFHFVFLLSFFLLVLLHLLFIILFHLWKSSELLI